MRPFTLFLVFGLIFSACSSQRTPIPPGEIPTPAPTLSSDEQYGHEVLGQLTQKFPLDRDDTRIERVRRIVDRLTKVRGNDQQIWHVYVLSDDTMKNAAATRGNFIFIWTGMLKAVENDAELAGILAHEIGHILAGHTQPSPTEAVNNMVTGVAGQVARQAIYSQGGQIGALASLGELLATEIVKAILINPESQQDEFEADQVGIFLAAEAGYDPKEMVTFWERVKNDPEFSNFPFQFLSSHPSSEERLEKLRGHLDLARERYKSPPQGNTAGEWTVGNR